MLFLAGPRQVGKTTLAQIMLKNRDGLYLNWDNPEDRTLILGKYSEIISQLGPKKLRQEKPIIIFDEVHKYKNWKNHLKGFYDLHKNDCHIIVTGSAKLDLYHKGGDSLMGRYFPYTIHPLSFGEAIKPDYFEVNKDNLFQIPLPDRDNTYDRLYHYGGFPDLYLQKSPSFSQQWQQTRFKQLFREDIRELSNVQDIAQLETLAILLQNQAGQVCHYSNLSNKIRVSDQSIRRWMSLLESTYYCFALRPWSKNITRSLLKEPKIYLWDWTTITNKGARFENFIACHLLKYVQLLTELGKGKFDLHYLKDKEKREVDFIITKNEEPWILIEAKHSEANRLSSSLTFFQEQIGADYALQVVHNIDYINQSCFQDKSPLIVPAKTFLSQLV